MSIPIFEYHDNDTLRRNGYMNGSRSRYPFPAVADRCGK